MRVVRYSEEPALWDSLDELSSRVWPEYNLHGDMLGPLWNRLYDERPDWQFVLYDEAEQVPLAEGHTIPSPRRATTCFRPAWPPCTSTTSAMSGSTGNPTSG